MNQNTSLRRKIILVFLGYSLLLSTLTVIAVIVSTQVSETRMQEDRLKMEAEYYLSDHLATFAAPASNSFYSKKPSSPFITYYYGDDLLPSWVKGVIPGLKPGTYFKDHDKQKYCILIQRLPDGDVFYLIYNVTRLNMETRSLKSLQITILLTLLPVLILGVTLGLITARKVIGPVIKLGEAVKDIKATKELPENYDKEFIRHDEIGYLAGSLKNALKGMSDAVERETMFARDASHELRTPVTTIKNSIELLEAKKPVLDESTTRIFGRISRAAGNMEHLIQSFLWLSRQDKLGTFDKKEVRLRDIVDEVIVENSYLVDKKPIDIIVHDDYAFIINVEPQLIKILISNLIRNAFTYTAHGSIDVWIKTGCFQVRDSGKGINAETLQLIKNMGKIHAEGFGFGLAIVKRLCSSMGWTFYISSEPNVGTETRICYNFHDKCENCNGVQMTSENTVRGSSDERLY